jgi:hypothetical protein
MDRVAANLIDQYVWQTGYEKLPRPYFLALSTAVRKLGR